MLTYEDLYNLYFGDATMAKRVII